MKTYARHVGAVAALQSMLLTACDVTPVANNQGSSVPMRRTPLKGYRNIEFGSSFMEAIGTLGADLFNPSAVSDCFTDLPLKGCYLSRNMDRAPFEMKDGIPYTLSLSFNRHDKLTDIGLIYEREGDISRADCLQIHGRTLDWLTREYGPLRFHQQRPERTIERQRLRTPGGHVYEVGSAADRFFVTAPMRTVSQSAEPGFERRPFTQWDGDRYVSLLSTFIIVDGNPNCRVSVDFNEPDSVERRPLED